MTGGHERVLVLAPTGRDAALSSSFLAEDGIASEICPTIEALCAAAADPAGVILIAEEALPPPAVQRLVAALDHQPPWSDIPLIVLAGGEFGASARRPLNVLGALRNMMILERPVRRLILARTVTVALRARRRQFELQAHLEERTALLARERAARADAEVANRMKDEFLMTVSHELRTPLTAIYGWARMLLTGEIRDDQKLRAIERIERNARVQTRLVNDLLDVSRAISGKLRLDVRPLDLGPVISEAVESVQPAADAKGVRLETRLDATAGPILGDPERIQQIVWNLTSNAIKFTPRGGRVLVTLTRTPSHAEVVVRDTGCGIAPDFLPYVFDRFRQGEAGTTRQHGGLGLGLAVVRHLVELHGGRVGVESAGPDQGAVFSVTLPLLDQPGHTAAGAQPAAVPRTAPSSQTPRRLDGVRVLVVDDDPEARELFVVVAESLGAEIRIAPSARDAVEILSVWRPDALLSDIEMPLDDGYALMRQLRHVDEAHTAPIAAIAVTAHSRPQDRLRALAAGFNWHLPKPVDPSELVAVLASLTGR
jgi:signal transduction histidine kinase